MTQTLFDPSPYGEESKPRRVNRQVAIPTEPLEAGWTAVRNRQGVLPFFHLIASESPHLGVATLCGSKGSRLSNVGVDYMVRCPLCQLATEM